MNWVSAGAGGAAFPTQTVPTLAGVCHASSWSFSGMFFGFDPFACRNQGYLGLQPYWSFLGGSGSQTWLDVAHFIRPWVDSRSVGVLGLKLETLPSTVTFKAYAATLEVSWDQPSSPPILTAPDNFSTVSSLTPTLSWNVSTDPDAGQTPVQYQVKVLGGKPSTANADNFARSHCEGGAPVLWRSGSGATPYQPFSPTQAQIPAGVLSDGVTYYWAVSAVGGGLGIDRFPACSEVRSFKVDRRLGRSGPFPFEEFGSGGVNLINGNLVMDVKTHSFATVGGEQSLTLAYNSQGSVVRGLRGRYFGGEYPLYATGTSTHRDFTAAQIADRIDPNIDFDWKGGSPVATSDALDNFSVRWTGFVTVPSSGDYCFAGSFDDGVRIRVGSQLVLNSWAGGGNFHCGSGGGASKVLGMTAGETRPIVVEYFENNGSASAQLTVARNDVSLGVVPQSWLSPERDVLGPKWTLSVGESGVAIQAALKTDSGVTLRRSDGSSEEYRLTETGAYAGPDGDATTIRVDDVNGWITVVADGGMTYHFNPQGELQSAVSALDDRAPAATRYEWTPTPGAPAGSPAVLTKMIDPVSSVETRLRYWGDSACGSPHAGYAGAPGKLCSFATPDGRVTKLSYDSGGRLSVIESPGAEIAAFAYTGASEISRVRTALAHDVVAAGLRPDGDDVLWQFSYSGGRVATVTSPKPSASGSSQVATLTYGTFPTWATLGTSSISYSGLVEPLGYSRSVSFDALWREREIVAVDGSRTIVSYDGASERVSYIDSEPPGAAAPTMRSSTIYETNVPVGGLQRPVKTWGPAPKALFQSNSPHPLPTEINNIPTVETAYDEGISGLLAAWHDDTTVAGLGANRPAFVGAPVVHQLIGGESAWPFPGVPASGVPADWFSGRLTGMVHLDTAGSYQFRGWIGDAGARMIIDDEVVVDAWNTSSAWVTSTARTYAAGWHKVVIDFKAYTGTSTMEWQWLKPASSWQKIPASAMKPDLGLVTSDTGADGVVTTNGYSDPIAGFATSTSIDPTGLNLTSVNEYEARGTSGQYLRQTGRSLPALSSSRNSYSYYGASEVPPVLYCAEGVSHPRVAQRGLPKQSVAADPLVSGGPGGISRERIQDRSGRVIATRNSADSEWSCTEFDERGRIATQTFPGSASTATSGTTTYAARRINTNHAVGGDPLLSRIADPSGAILTRIDLLGRVTDTKDALGVTTHYTYDTAGRVLSTTVFNASNQVLSRSAPVYSGVLPTVNQPITYRYSFAPATVSGYNHVTLSASSPMPVPGAWTEVAKLSHDSSGRLISVEYSNSVVATLAYDAWGRQSGVSYSKPSGLIYSDSVTMDKTGRIVDRVNAGYDANSGGDNYTYDAAGRLTSWRERDTASGWYNQGTYGFDYAPGEFASACAGVPGANPDAGKNSNRTKQVRNVSGTTVTTTYCYDFADRIQKVNVSSGSNPYSSGFIYDAHGNATTHGANTLSFDGADRHMKTQSGSTSVEYERDVLNRVIGRKVNGTMVNRWAHSGAGDGAAITLSAAGTLQEVSISLPGGALYNYKPFSAGVWSLMNFHGDTASVVNEGGDGVFPTLTYDPFGQAFSYTAPDNTAGSFDYGWHGDAQKRLEHEVGLLPLIQMGARAYDPALGTFLEVDPVIGGCRNDYVYVGDPVNGSDLTGTKCPEKVVSIARFFGVGDGVRGLRAMAKYDFDTYATTLGGLALIIGVGQLIVDFVKWSLMQAKAKSFSLASAVSKANGWLTAIATGVDAICQSVGMETDVRRNPPGHSAGTTRYNPHTKTHQHGSGGQSTSMTGAGIAVDYDVRTH